MTTPIYELGDLVSIRKGKKAVDESEDPYEGFLRYIQIEDLRNNDSMKYARNPKGPICDENDVLIAWDGAKAGTVGFGLSGLVGSTIAILRPNDSVYAPYLGMVLQSKYQMIRDACTGATIPHVSKPFLLRMKIPLPSISEQKGIAAILDKAKQIRIKTENALNLKENIIHGVFLKMFGDPVVNPNDWGKVTVKEIATIVRGSSPRPKGDPRYYGEGVPRLMVADLTRDGMYVTPSIDSLTKEGAKKSRPMMKGDLVMAVSGRPGLPAILNEDCCIHDGFAGFRDLSQNFNKVYLYHYFKLYISQVSKRSVGAIFKNITTSDIRNIGIFDVSLDLQNHFADLAQIITSIDFSSLHNQVVNLEKSISKEMLT